MGGVFSSFFLCSQHVPFKFPMGSHQVPIRFIICSLGSQCVPQRCSQKDLALIPYVLPKVLPSLSQLYSWDEREAFHFSIESFILGSLHISTFFGMGQSNWLMAKKRKNKEGWTCESPVINLIY